MKELMSSPPYKAAVGKINAWTEKLEMANATEAKAIVGEYNAFFDKMKTEDPSMYTSFEVSRRSLDESAAMKTGDAPEQT